jgi:hypothetical protein
MTVPTVSVIMAAYNGADVIGESLASLAAQSFTDFEVVVVDDCSTDATRDVIRAFPDNRIRLIEAPVNGGPVRARNLAVTHARGRYLAALDHDDLCHPDRFAHQVSWLDAHPSCALIATDATVLWMDGAAGAPRPALTTPALLAWLIKISNPIVWSSVMIRADAAAKRTPFTDHERLYAEDFDLYHHLARHGTLARLDMPLVTYRDHPGGASKRHEARMIASAAIVLAEAYRDALGDKTTTAATLVAEHVMLGAAVPDRATLRTLGDVLRRLLLHHLATTPLAADDIALIKWETSRLWWRIARHAIRSGAIGLADAVAVRPDHLGLGHASLDDLLVSGVLGGVRRARARAASAPQPATA